MEEHTREVTMGWQSDTTLSESLAFMLEKELWTDVTFTFTSQEGVIQVKGHTVILAARSPVFQAMFYGQMDSQREVKIEDASPESFKIFLRCLYTEDVDLEENILTRVIEIAHKYQAGYLLDLCSEKLVKYIGVDNACHILNLAVFYNLNTLQEAACNLIDDNADKILETPGFMNISVQTLKVILAGDTFYSDELTIFRKCMDWAENKCKELNLEPHDENKRHVFGDAFIFLRLPTLSLFDYTENVAKTKLLSIEESHAVYMFKCSPSLQIDLKNSITQRKPNLDTILLPGDQMEIKFHCPNDILLLGLTLDQSKTPVQKDSMPFFHPKSVVDEQPKKHLRVIALQGKLVIQGTDMNVTFRTPYKAKLPKDVKFKKSLLLKGKDEPYTIAVEASVYTSYNVLYLERLRDMCMKDCLNFTLRNILYKPWPCSEYRHFITGVLYKNNSNREAVVLNS